VNRIGYLPQKNNLFEALFLFEKKKRNGNKTKATAFSKHFFFFSNSTVTYVPPPSLPHQLLALLGNRASLC